MTEAVPEIDLHGKNAYQCRIAIDAALRRATPGTYRLRLIHGYNSGTALKELIHDEYAHHARVLRISKGPNPGITDLVLREF